MQRLRMEDNSDFNDLVSMVRQFLSASITKTVLLLLDGHFMHMQNIEVIGNVSTNAVVMFYFLSHCIYRLQTLDIGIMKPLGVYYKHACSNWLEFGCKMITFQIQQ